MTSKPYRALFISDFHLGIPDNKKSREREDRIIRFLETQEGLYDELFILGDMFDFWFEYKHVVPKGFVRIQAKLAAISDKGIPVHFFTGNHDQWLRDYFQEELGMIVHTDPWSFERHGKKFFVGHGDGLGPGDHGYKFIRKVFRARFSRWLFRWLHPDIGVGIANYFSKKSRLSTGNFDEKYLGDDNEWLLIFARDEVKKGHHADYFIFGHRHLPLDKKVAENSRYINLGDWIRYNTYAYFDGEELRLEKFEEAKVPSPGSVIKEL